MVLRDSTTVNSNVGQPSYQGHPDDTECAGRATIWGFRYPIFTSLNIFCLEFGNVG